MHSLHYYTTFNFLLISETSRTSRPKTSQAAQYFHVKFRKLHDSGPDALSFGSASTKVALPNLRNGLVSMKESVGIWEKNTNRFHSPSDASSYTCFVNHGFSKTLPSTCGSNWMIHNWPGNFAFQASKSMSGFVMSTRASSSWPWKHPAVVKL